MGDHDAGVLYLPPTAADVVQGLRQDQTIGAITHIFQLGFRQRLAALA